MLIGIFPIIIKEARKVTDSVMNEYKAEQSFARSINEDN